MEKYYKERSVELNIAGGTIKPQIRTWVATKSYFGGRFVRNRVEQYVPKIYGFGTENIIDEVAAQERAKARVWIDTGLVVK